MTTDEELDAIEARLNEVQFIGPLGIEADLRRVLTLAKEAQAESTELRVTWDDALATLKSEVALADALAEALREQYDLAHDQNAQALAAGGCDARCARAADLLTRHTEARKGDTNDDRE